MRPDKEHYIVFQKFLPNMKCIVHFIYLFILKDIISNTDYFKGAEKYRYKKNNSSLWKFVYIYLKPSGYYKGHYNLMQI